MITKLYEKKYGCQPANSPKNVATGGAPGAPSNLLSAKPTTNDGQISDDYDDDFDEPEDSKQREKKASATATPATVESKAPKTAAGA